MTIFAAGYTVNLARQRGCNCDQCSLARLVFQPSFRSQTSLVKNSSVHGIDFGPWYLVCFQCREEILCYLEVETGPVLESFPQRCDRHEADWFLDSFIFDRLEFNGWKPLVVDFYIVYMFTLKFILTYCDTPYISSQCASGYHLQGHSILLSLFILSYSLISTLMSPRLPTHAYNRHDK